MSLYSYRKEESTVKRRVISSFSYLSLIAGALLLFWAFYPILSFEVYSRLFIQNKIIAPIPSSDIASSIMLAHSVYGQTATLSNNLRDFTQASLWFPTTSQGNLTQKISLKEYSLSIPKLNIERAKVTVGGEDLAKSLVHYLPQSLPGENGNVAIFGHSTLPQLYNAKDYKTIFTYLPSLERNDKVILRVNDIDYEYEVYEMFVVKPDQVSVLEQKHDASYLTLVTCVPPGTYWNRLVVRARLTKLPNSL